MHPAFLYTWIKQQHATMQLQSISLGFGQMPFFVYGFQDETISSRDLNLTSCCYSLYERW